jgi:nucleoid DNA-binding protein
MKYTDFIKELAVRCNEQGVRISAQKLKIIISCISDLVVEKIEEEESIKLKEFLIFDFIEIPPRTMPDGREIEKQYSLRVRMSDSYKKRIKEYLNGKNKGED